MDGINTLNFNLDVIPLSEIFRTDTKEFKEFNEYLQMMDEYMESLREPLEIYYDYHEPEVIISNEGTSLYKTEALEDNNRNAKKTIGNALKNATSASSSIGKTYGSVTDAGGGLLKALWDLFVKMIKIISSVVIFVAKKLTVLPKSILYLMNKATSLPSSVLNKIQGNIVIHLTPKDIQNIYRQTSILDNQSLMQRLDVYMSQLKLVTEGSVWSTLFHNNILGRSNKFWRKDVRDSNTINKKVKDVIDDLTDNDIRMCKKLTDGYEELTRINFSETTIKFVNKETIETYFGKVKSVKFVDLKGNKHEETYYGALSKLCDDLNKYKDVFAKLEQDFSNKYIESLNSGQFASFSKRRQRLITSTSVSISKVMSLIGNLVKCIIKDMNTINKAMQSVDKYIAKLNKKKVDKPSNQADSDDTDSN